MGLKDFLSKITDTISSVAGETFNVGPYTVQVQKKLGEGIYLFFF